MGRFRNGFESWLIPAIAPWLDYVETGKPPLQKAIAGVKDELRYWITALVKRMNSPRGADDKDRRAIHLLTAYKCFLAIAQWIDHDLVRERPGEDLQGMLRREMA